jgi:hypothetical protein
MRAPRVEAVERDRGFPLVPPPSRNDTATRVTPRTTRATTVSAGAGPSSGKVGPSNHTMALRTARSTCTARNRLSCNATFRPPGCPRQAPTEPRAAHRSHARRFLPSCVRRTWCVSASPDTGSREHVRFAGRLVRGDDQARPLVTRGHQEEQVRGLGLERDDQWDPPELDQLLLQPAGVVGLGQAGNPLGGSTPVCAGRTVRARSLMDGWSLATLPRSAGPGQPGRS